MNSNLLPPLLSVRDIIRLYGLTARSQLSQNFLLDLNITGACASLQSGRRRAHGERRLDRIVRCVPAIENAVVVEVGPGPGSLTRSLLQSKAHCVIGVEKDARFMPSLHVRSRAMTAQCAIDASLGRQMLADASRGRFHPIQGDILEATHSSLLDAVNAQMAKGSSLRLVGNLPFNVATPLLIKWLRMLSYRQGIFAPDRDVSMTLMFQKEVAQRMIAPPRRPERGRLAILAQHLCHVSTVYDIPRTAFVPRPDVTATVVNLSPRPKPYAGTP